jgi:hypothetical protein
MTIFVVVQEEVRSIEFRQEMRRAEEAAAGRLQLLVGNPEAPPPVTFSLSCTKNIRTSPDYVLCRLCRRNRLSWKLFNFLQCNAKYEMHAKESRVKLQPNNWSK